MRNLRSFSLAASAAVLLAASPAALRSQQSATDAADTRVLAAYRLTMPTVRKIAKAYENMMPLAEDAALAQRVAASESDDGNTSLDDMAKFLGSIPEIRSAITRAGLTPREFAVGTMALFQASMVVGFSDWAKEKGQTYDEAAAGASQANVAFIRANKAEIEQVMSKLKAWEDAQKKAKRAEPDSEDGDESGMDDDGDGDDDDDVGDDDPPAVH